MKIIDYQNVYSLTEPPTNRAYRGRIDNCPIMTQGEVCRGETSLDEVVKIEYFMGEAQPKDVIWTSSAYPLILSEFVIELLIKNGITGWDTYPTVVYDKKANEVPSKYFGLIIKGRAGFIDYKRSEIVMKENDPDPYVKGKYFYNDEWDGSDFFMENPDQDNEITMHRYCTGKVFQLFKDNKIGNIAFENTSQEDDWYYTLESDRRPKLKVILQDLLSKTGK